MKPILYIKESEVSKMDMNNLYDWVFNYNPYTKEWRAVKREDYPILFSGVDKGLILRSSDVNTLVEIIAATNGDTTKIKNLIMIDK